MAWKGWSDEDVETARQMYESGVDMAGIAKHFGRTARSVQMKLWGTGLVKPMIWTPEVIATMRRMRAEGITTSIIAKRLGVTRSAILGKAHRLGLPPTPKREPAPKPAAKPRKIAAPKPKPVKIAAIIPIEPEPFVEPVGLKQIWELTVRECRFPIGDVGADDFGFCAQECGAEDSYCGHHKSVCYMKKTPAKGVGFRFDPRRRAA